MLAFSVPIRCLGPSGCSLSGRPSVHGVAPSPTAPASSRVSREWPHASNPRPSAGVCVWFTCMSRGASVGSGICRSGRWGRRRLRTPREAVTQLCETCGWQRRRRRAGGVGEGCGGWRVAEAGAARGVSGATHRLRAVGRLKAKSVHQRRSSAQLRAETQLPGARYGVHGALSALRDASSSSGYKIVTRSPSLWPG